MKQTKYRWAGEVVRWGQQIEPPFHEAGSRKLTVIVKGPFAYNYVVMDCEEVDGDFFENLWSIKHEGVPRLRCVIELRPEGADD